MQTKHLTGQIEKAKQGDNFDGTFILSTEDEDRQGDVIELDGWDLRNFRKNPVALWQHDHAAPIGTWENIRIDSGRLIGELKLASTRLAEMARQLIADGVLRAVSVGFMPTKMEPREKGGWTIKAAELLEASLVSVPANQAALMISKSLDLTDEELAVVFNPDTLPAKGKSADAGRIARAREFLGKSAELQPRNSPKPTEAVKMKPIAELIKEKTSEIQEMNEILPEKIALYDEDPSDENEAVLDDLNARLEKLHKQLSKLQETEQNLMKDIASRVVTQPATKNQAPAIITTRKDYEPGELFVRQAAVTAIAHITRQHVGEVMRDRYRNDKGLEAIMTKADSVIGTTTGTNWAAPLLEESVEGFLDLFTNNSVYGSLRALGTSLNFAGKGSIKIPSRGSSKKPAGGFVGEGNPIPVKETYFTSQTMTPDKMAVIVPFSEELVTATNGQIESIIRAAIIQDTAEALDAILLDSTAVSAIRPAGLLNGVTLTTSAGATAANIATDVKTLMANFVSTDTPKSVRFIMNGARVLGLRTVTTTTGDRAFPEVSMGNILGIPFIESGNCTAAEVYSVDGSSFYTAYDAPRFSMSNTAVLHMEDTTPLEIVSGTGPTTADPVRSLFQTDSVAIRMILPVTWKMVRSGMVDGIDTVAW